jgi:hypothetical protein
MLLNGKNDTIVSHSRSQETDRGRRIDYPDIANEKPSHEAALTPALPRFRHGRANLASRSASGVHFRIPHFFIIRTSICSISFSQVHLGFGRLYTIARCPINGDPNRPQLRSGSLQSSQYTRTDTPVALTLASHISPAAIKVPIRFP